MTTRKYGSKTLAETYWAIRLPDGKLFAGSPQAFNTRAGSAVELDTVEGTMRAWSSKADAKIRFGQLREDAEAVGTAGDFDDRAELVQFEAVMSIYEVDSIRRPLADHNEVPF